MLRENAWSGFLLVSNPEPVARGILLMRFSTPSESVSEGTNPRAAGTRDGSGGALRRIRGTTRGAQDLRGALAGGPVEESRAKPGGVQRAPAGRSSGHQGARLEKILRAARSFWSLVPCCSLPQPKQTLFASSGANTFSTLSRSTKSWIGAWSPLCARCMRGLHQDS